MLLETVNVPWPGVIVPMAKPAGIAFERITPRAELGDRFVTVTVTWRSMPNGTGLGVIAIDTPKSTGMSSGNVLTVRFASMSSARTRRLLDTSASATNGPRYGTRFEPLVE